MNTKLSYVEFLQRLNDPKSRLHKLYDVKYKNCNLDTDYFFSPVTGIDDKLPPLTLNNWIRKWPDLCHHFAFRYERVNSGSTAFIYGDVTLITFETHEFKRTSLSVAELYTLLACASVVKCHGLHSLVDNWLVDMYFDSDMIDNIIDKLAVLNPEGAIDNTTYVVEEFYE